MDKPLTNLQRELLNIYSIELPEAQLPEIRELLARYFADKTSDEMDRLWQEQGWTQETMEQWLKSEEE